MPDACRICKQSIANEQGYTSAGLLMVRAECPLCGAWKGHADSVVPEIQEPANALLMPFLAAHIRQANLVGNTVVELTAGDWRRWAISHAHTPVPQKLEMLLRWFERHSDFAGAKVVLQGNLAPLVDAKNQDEVGFLCETLVEQKALEPFGAANNYRITAKGWERLSPSAAGEVFGTCFVAMSFEAALNPVYDEGIRPALEDDCGFRVIRVDRVEHNDNINDIIISELRAAQVVVADFTGHRSGVYFEAGYALGLGRTVVFTCRQDDFKDAHFDTRPYGHILWKDSADLREKLTRRIRATASFVPKMIS